MVGTKAAEFVAFLAASSVIRHSTARAARFPASPAVDDEPARPQTAPVSTLRVYLRIQAMVFVVGIVGPLFLGIYFAAQPDPTVRWMYWWGLFLTAGEILAALGVTESIVRREGDGGHTQRS
jgi:hypothetical protein